MKVSFNIYIYRYIQGVPGGFYNYVRGSFHLIFLSSVKRDCDKTLSTKYLVQIIILRLDM